MVSSPAAASGIPAGNAAFRPIFVISDLSLVGKTLFETNGNIARAAKILDVDSADLRQFARAKPELVALVD
jgi:hypothetical protein